MKHLLHSQIAELDRLLERRHFELRHEIRRLLLQSEHQHHHDLAGAVHDAGDESVANLLTDIDAAFIDRDFGELREVEAARGRLRGSTYGVCGDCGEEIAWGRLKAWPTTTRCVACASRYEKTHRHEGTPTL
jgi:DnaK suppressor protein